MLHIFHVKERGNLLPVSLLLWGLGLLLIFTACSSIDCPLNNRVYTRYSLRTPDGEVDTLKLYTTISTNRVDGTDSVLINKDVNITSFSLPISNTQPCDSFFVQLATEEQVLSVDTILVSKENKMHFESTDCAASYFHDITDVATTHHAIDSVKVKNSVVNYDTSKSNFYIYFTPRN